MAGMVHAMISDTVMSFMWVWSSAIIKIFVYRVLGFTYGSIPGEFVRCCLYLINMFFFAYLSKLTNGGAYNPLTLLSPAFSRNLPTFLFTVGVRIPLQVFGSIIGVRLILETFPEIGRGPQLSTSVHQGALTEGLLTFTIVLISHSLAMKIPGSFFRKTWISSVSKLALQVLGSDLTGRCMNPASAIGWAYARGDHMTKEHILVYWVAPIEATLLVIWVFRLVVKQEKTKTD